MTVILPQFSEPSPTTELILYVDNLRPIRLADFAKTLSADYSAATGRNLVVSGFEQGSLSAIFREAAEYADSANHLRRLQISLNFGITFTAMLSHVQNGPKMVRHQTRVDVIK